jgi:hypothetical protein
VPEPDRALGGRLITLIMSDRRPRAAAR